MMISADGTDLCLGHSASNLDNHKKQVRRRIVNLIFIIYWLLIFEGALRKWVFPEYQRIIFFIRDPFVLLIYFWVFYYRMWTRRSLFLTIAFLLSTASLCLILFHLLANEYSLLLSAYGWRNYFFYIPLAFIIGEHFRVDDLNRLCRHTLLITIPVALLVFLQSLAPHNSVINQGISEDPRNIFGNLGVAFGIVRTHGTFTSSAGQNMFIGSVVAMVITAWILPQRERPLKRVALFVSTGAVISILALSGSRGAFLISFLIVLFSLLSGLVLSEAGTSFKSFAVPLAMALIGVLILPILFPIPLDALWYRSVGTAALDPYPYSIGIVVRTLNDFINFTNIFPNTPLSGFGIGMGTNAATRIGIVGIPWNIEDDWSRNIVDLGPILGLLFIAFRIAFVGWLCSRAIVATKMSNNPLPMLLFGFIGIIIFYGQITGQGTIGGYGWMFAGFCMAAKRLDMGHTGNNADTYLNVA